MSLVEHFTFGKLPCPLPLLETASLQEGVKDMVCRSTAHGSELSRWPARIERQPKKPFTALFPGDLGKCHWTVVLLNPE